MHIAIDITPLHSGHKDRGVGMYTKLLIEALQKYENRHSYYLFTQPQFSKTGAGFTRGQKIPNDIELIHYPYFDPFFVTLPFFFRKPAVITVHDLIPLVFPERFPAGVRGALKWQYQRARLTCARRVITDSFSSRRDIEHVAGIPGSRIDVVYLAPSSQYRPVTNKTVLSAVKSKYNLPDSFILYVGDINWNKNIMGMLEAFRIVKSLCQRRTSLWLEKSKVKLVLVGKAFLDNSVKEAQQISSFIDLNNLGESVMRVGSVPRDDLVALYNLASVYIQPSFYEGFGLPVLEAMACGVPVVTSQKSSLVEIAGPAIAVDPSDPQDVARGLLKALLMTPSARSLLVNAQTKWVQQFSWERVARQTVITYEKAQT